MPPQIDDSDDSMGPMENDPAKEMTKRELKAARLPYSKIPRKLRNSVTYGNALKLQIAETASTSKKNKELLTAMLSGSAIMMANKCTALAQNLGLHSRKVTQYNGIPTSELQPTTRDKVKRDEVRKTVIDFLSRDECSRLLPGKKDFTTVGDEEFQTRALNDYVEVIFERFSSEYPDTCSRTQFYQYRPKWIQKSSEIKYSSCLCRIHENFGLLLKSLKPYVNKPLPVNPDSFHKMIETMDGLNELFSDDVHLGVTNDDKVAVRQWASVEVTEIIKVKKKDVITELACPIIHNQPTFQLFLEA